MGTPDVSLILPRGPSWASCTTNLSGTPSATPGTAVTAGANNADGTAVSAIAAIAHDVEHLVIGIAGFQTSGGNGKTLLDVLIDPAGGSTWNATPLIGDLLAGCSPVLSTIVSFSPVYEFPLWIKSGASIGLQARTAHTAALAGQVVIKAIGGNANPGTWWCGKTVDSIAITAASSKGTDHTPGNTGTFSAWTNLGSTLSAACGALQFAVQGSDTGGDNLQYHWEFGVNSTRIGPNIYRRHNTGETGWVTPQGPIFRALPSGAQLQVRATCSGVAEVFDVAAYAVM